MPAKRLGYKKMLKYISLLGITPQSKCDCGCLRNQHHQFQHESRIRLRCTGCDCRNFVVGRGAGGWAW